MVKTMVEKLRNYSLQLKSMLERFDNIINDLSLDKHPSEREWLISCIDNKLKLASLQVNEDVLNILAQYIERDYLGKPFTGLEALSTTTDDEFEANIRHPKMTQTPEKLKNKE